MQAKIRFSAQSNLDLVKNKTVVNILTILTRWLLLNYCLWNAWHRSEGYANLVVTIYYMEKISDRFYGAINDDNDLEVLPEMETLVCELSMCLNVHTSWR